MGPAFLLPLLLSPAAAPAPAPASTAALLQASCRACGDTGQVACRACRRDACPPTERLLFCSANLGCEECGGLGTLPCKRCERDVSEARERRRRDLAQWRLRIAPVDEFMERALLHAESEHFLLTYDLEKIDVEGGGKPHGGMHVYLDRLETLFDEFVGDVSAEPERDFFGKTHVLLWSRESDQEKASLRFTRQPSKTESKLMGASPVVSVFYDQNYLHEEFEMHQAVVHQVAHCLLSNVFDGIWPGNVGGGWLDAGLAHHYEVAKFGGVRHYCYTESDTIRRFQFGRWEPAVRAAVARDEAPALLGIAGRHTGDLRPEEHMFAWSYVDFVLRGHPGRLGDVARGVKAKKPLREVLQQSLGLTPFEFDAAWRSFVLESYSRRAK